MNTEHDYKLPWHYAPPPSDEVCANIYNNAGELVATFESKEDALFVERITQNRDTKELREQAEQWKSTFRHYHRASKLDDDACAECGLDLRNSIHIRLQEES